MFHVPGKPLLKSSVRAPQGSSGIGGAPPAPVVLEVVELEVVLDVVADELDVEPVPPAPPLEDPVDEEPDDVVGEPVPVVEPGPPLVDVEEPPPVPGPNVAKSKLHPAKETKKSPERSRMVGA